MGLVLLGLGRHAGQPYPVGTADRWRLVCSVCEFMYLTRPLCEWCAFSDRHHETRDWLMTTFEILGKFRRDYPELLAQCCPLKRRIFTGEKKLVGWLTSGVPGQALYRAQFLPLGLSAFIRRIVSPSPGRDCFLSANARGCFYRTWRIGGGVGPVSHTLAASALCTWAR
jgi:hypothetical protein